MDLSNQDAKDKNLVVGHHYEFIDGLRAVAVLLVIWFHSSEFVFTEDMVGLVGAYYTAALIGQTAVDLFFVISGFLITGILIDSADLKGRYKRFYTRRTLRIFPLYYAFILLFGLVLMSEPPEMGSDKGHFIYYLFYLQNWLGGDHLEGIYVLLNHTWSLAIEEQFYLIWPFVFWSLYKRSYMGTMIFCVALIIVSAGCRFYFAAQEEYVFAYKATICHFDSIAMGALCSLLYFKYKDQILRYRIPVMLCGAVSFIIFLILLYTRQNSTDSHLFMMSNGLIFTNIFYMCIFMLLLIAREGNAIKKALCHRFLRFSGKISYGLYIFHFPVGMMIAASINTMGMGYAASHSITLLLILPVCYLIAWLSYTYLEMPILKLKGKYAP